MSFLWSFGTKKEATVPNVLPQIPSPQSFKTMSNAFRKGVQYNMKIVLRGDVMTGKTSLFQRLQGAEFEEPYNSTPQIEVANIPWHYKESSDIVKIEVWDVVDKVHNKTKSAESQAIKLEHNTAEKQTVTSSKLDEEKEVDVSMGLDASTVNVYRNSHCVIFMFDITKPWTFDYVNKEIENVPETISILVLGNFSDKVQERKVEVDDIHLKLYNHNQERIKKGAIKPNLIRYVETSMKSGLGLKFIYEYLGVPFLQLMIESLNKQLELKAVEIVDLLEELDTNEDVPETLQRRRGQDNFIQPSEPRLIQEQEQNEWDQELERIASDHPSMLDNFERKDTPPIPTAPIKKKKNAKFVPEEIPQVSYLEDDKINDDWFNNDDDDDDDNNLKLNLNNNNNRQNESDDDKPSNPMVLGDEDVEPTFYYSNNTNTVNHNKHVQIAVSEDEVAEEEIEVEEEEEEEEEDHSYKPPVFKSELDNIWSHDVRRISGPEIISDSDDEDNNIAHFSMEGYEEISGTNDNPWSIQDNNDNDWNVEKPAEEPKKKKKSSSKKKHKKKQSL